MNVLVTGGAGFIGSHVVERLLAIGHTVTVVDDFNSFYAPVLKRRNTEGFRDRAQIVETDILDGDTLRAVFQRQRFETIIHLAARAGVQPSLGQPLSYITVNVCGTQLLLDLAREFGVRQFIFGSSSSVYGINPHVPFRESDPVLQPISPYAATKLAGEALCHVAHHLCELGVVCLRFFTVYGPRQRPDLAIHKFTRAILRGDPIELYGDGTTRRDYTFVDDIVQGVEAALNLKTGFETINLGGSQAVGLLELVRLIEHAAKRRAIIRWLPSQPGDVPVTYADIAKANRLLGYTPRVPIDQGIPIFVAWLRDSSVAGLVQSQLQDQ